VSLVGLLHFDGNGNVSGSNIYIVVNGSVSGPETVPPGATYDVSSDCTISVPFTTSLASHGVIVGVIGSEVVGDLENNKGTATGTIDIKKVAEWDDR
jgi:hypothetical protein